MRFMIQHLGNPRPELEGPAKLLLQQRTLAVTDPTIKPFEVCYVIAQRPAQRFPVHQTDITPQFRPARGDAGEILEASGAVTLQIDPF